MRSGPFRDPAPPRSVIQPIARPEHPSDDGQTDQEEAQGRRQTDADADATVAVEGPVEARYQIDTRIEQGDRARPWRRQLEGIEGPAKEGQMRDNQYRVHLQLFAS